MWANRTTVTVNTCVLIQSGQTSDGEDDRSDDHDKRLQSVSVDDSSEAACEAKGNLLLVAHKSNSKMHYVV